MELILRLLLALLEVIGRRLCNLIFDVIYHTVVLLLPENVLLQLLCLLFLKSQIPFKCLLVDPKVLLIK